MVKEILIKNKFETVWFEFTEPVWSLWIQAELKENLWAQIFLYNPAKQLCGIISPGSRFVNEMYISDTFCTLNGRHHPLQSGIYTLVIVPFYDVQSEAAEIRITGEVNITKTYDEKYCQSGIAYKEPSFTKVTGEACRFYKGDFHGHTIYSDGHYTMQEAGEILKQQEMDFMAFTEHNSMAFGEPSLPCLSIPAFELTLPAGHVNIHGVRNFELGVDQLLKCKNYEELLEMTLNLYSPGSNVSLNHMFLEPWHFTYENLDLSRVNTIEVICDPTYGAAPEANDRAAVFLDFLWNQGYRIFGIGGSDSHNRVEELYEGSEEPSIFGDPATYVYCKGLSVQNVLDGIRNGHCYTARYVTLDISINGGKYLPGDLIFREKEILYKIDIWNINQPLKGCFLLNGKVIREYDLTKNQEQVCLSFQYTSEPWWLRFGLYDWEGHIIAYVNPIYNQIEKLIKKNFRNLLDEFGEIYDKGHTV